jgi:hypothetical protein
MYLMFVNYISCNLNTTAIAISLMNEDAIDVSLMN